MATTKREAMEQITPDELRAYLRMNGWTESSEEARPGYYEIWYPPDDTQRRPGQREVIVPLHQDFGDYASRISESVKAILDHEERWREVVADIKAGKRREAP